MEEVEFIWKDLRIEFGLRMKTTYYLTSYLSIQIKTRGGLRKRVKNKDKKVYERQRAQKLTGVKARRRPA